MGIDQNHELMNDMVSKWFQVVFAMLSKEKKFSGMESLISAVDSSLQFYTDKQKNPLSNLGDSLPFAVEALSGLICLLKGDLQGVRSLAIKLGGFPK